MKTQPGSNRTIFIVAISAILLIACAFAIILFFVFFGFILYRNQPIPTPKQTAHQVDLIWDRINQNQKIVVGISADYPPFAYIDQNFAIQGYDLALIQEVATLKPAPRYSKHGFRCFGKLPVPWPNRYCYRRNLDHPYP